MRPSKALLCAIAFAVPLVAAARPARADASAWFFLGGGAAQWKQAAPDFHTTATMTVDVGVGTSPDGVVILGGLFRLQPLFTSGVDLAAMLRAATRGFQAGGFGVALDAGGFQRFWGVGSTGFMGDLTLGAPLGLGLTVQGSYGTNTAVGYGATLGIDLLRLTVYRQSLTDYWKNPLPAQTRKSGFKGLLAFF